MTEHPSIAAMMNHGYEHPEPEVFSKCVNCGSEIFTGEGYEEAAEYHYCDVMCFVELCKSEGNLTSRIAGE